MVCMNRRSHNSMMLFYQGLLRMKSLHMAYLLLSLTYFIISPCFALPTDKDQPMYLTANTGHLNKATGINLFQGNIKVTQGSSILLADTLVLHTNKKNQLIEADAQGNLANFSTVTDIKKPRFVGVAQTIQYFPQQRIINLIGDAKATQGPNSYSAPRIEYNIDQQSVVSQASSQGRTTIIIQPQSIQKSKETS
jgi:lipopolysaccharide export system protein LptA